VCRRMKVMRAVVRQGNSIFSRVIRQSWSFHGGDDLAPPFEGVARPGHTLLTMGVSGPGRPP
jgi:hypothetical protein